MSTNSIQVLKTSELCGRQFVVYGTPEEPLFSAKEVAECIDYSKSGNGSYNVTQMLSSIDDDEKLSFTTNNLSRETWFLTEGGLYEVLMQSRKPIAKQFKKGVQEILKSIRKTGSYSTASDNIKQLEDLSTKQEETAEMLERKIVCTQNAQYELNKIVNDMKEAICFTRNKVDYIWRNFDKLLNPNRPSHPAGKPVRDPQGFDTRKDALSDPDILEVQYGFIIGILDFARRLRYVLHRPVSSQEVEDWLYGHGFLSMESERFGMPDGIAKENDYLVSTGRMWLGLCASFITKEGEKYFTELIVKKGGLK